MDICTCCNGIPDCHYEFGDKFQSLYFNSIYGTYDDDYGSFTQDINSKEELLEFLPWISFDEIDNNNFCNQCLRQLLIDKKIYFECIRYIIYPLYTDCCDKLIFDNAHTIRINDNFPYKTTCYTYDPDFDETYYDGDWSILGKRKYVNIYCEECFQKIKDSFTSMNPLKGYSKELEYSYLEYKHEERDDYYYYRIKPIDVISGSYHDIYLNIPLTTHYDLMKKLMKELDYHIVRRNLKILLSKYHVSKDCQNYILSIL